MRIRNLTVYSLGFFANSVCVRKGPSAEIIAQKNLRPEIADSAIYCSNSIVLDLDLLISSVDLVPPDITT